MRASIRRLCPADHGGDPDRIAAWCANKTAARFRRWLADPHTRLFVAELDGRIAAVGSVSTDGEVLLNYVAPRARFRGASSALLARLEAELAALGHAEGRLESTAPRDPSTSPRLGRRRSAHELARHARLADAKAAAAIRALTRLCRSPRLPVRAPRPRTGTCRVHARPPKSIHHLGSNTHSHPAPRGRAAFAPRVGGRGGANAARPPGSGEGPHGANAARPRARGLTAAASSGRR
jgi:hypothetical protein